MNGWIVLGVLFVVAAAALWLMRVRGPLWLLAVAFLLFGCAGYALQGRPGLPGSPTPAQGRENPMPMAEMRHAFFGDFTAEESWLILSDSYASRGETEDSVAVMDQAVKLHPTDPELWIGLGNALVDHAEVLTPASEYAYKRAAELAPGHPAPLFFFGLALARSGDRDGALAAWKEVLANAPADASWRPMVEDAVAVVSGPNPHAPQKGAGS